jgi:hypothetical protein
MRPAQLSADHHLMLSLFFFLGSLTCEAYTWFFSYAVWIKNSLLGKFKVSLTMTSRRLELISKLVRKGIRWQIVDGVSKTNIRFWLFVSSFCWLSMEVKTLLCWKNMPFYISFPIPTWISHLQSSLIRLTGWINYLIRAWIVSTSYIIIVFSSLS